MAQITEDYVSFETAKLLKEKGFDEYCPLWYNLDKPTEGPFFYKEIGWYGHNSYDYNGKRIISAPTLQMAMKWLRKEHKIIPIILTGEYSQKPLYYWFRIDAIIEGRLKDAIYREDVKEFSSHEEACDAAIQYCLKNLI